ncbi:MAG: hypothetical protein AAGG53_16580 [Cyanobacteria bacterium P01_H01_bin.152]
MLTTARPILHPELLCHYLKVCPHHLAGAILIPGFQGYKEATKLYPEYWQWSAFHTGKPTAFLQLLQDYPSEHYGFHDQLWCGVFAPPAKPYDVTVLYSALQGHPLQQVIAAMMRTDAKLYPSAFDLRELLEDLNLEGKAIPEEFPTNGAIMQQVCSHLLQGECRQLLIDNLNRLEQAQRA